MGDMREGASGTHLSRPSLRLQDRKGWTGRPVTDRQTGPDLHKGFLMMAVVLMCRCVAGDDDVDVCWGWMYG